MYSEWSTSEASGLRSYTPQAAGRLGFDELRKVNGKNETEQRINILGEWAR